VTNWEQQYVALNQQNVSSTDLVQQLSSLIDENQRLKQVIEHLNTDIQASNVSMATSSPEGCSSAVQSELSDQLVFIKNELNVARGERDRMREQIIQLISELTLSRTDLKEAHSSYADKIQAVEKQSKNEIFALNSQLEEARVSLGLFYREMEAVRSDPDVSELQILRSQVFKCVICSRPTINYLLLIIIIT